MMHEQILYTIIVILLVIIASLAIKLFFSKQRRKINELEADIRVSKIYIAKLKDDLLFANQTIEKITQSQKPTSFLTDQLETIEELKKEISRQKQRVEDTKLIAQKANMVKYDFLSNIRHEVRTPMNSILAFSDMLKYELKDAKQLSYVNNIFTSGHKLLNLMDNIIELSRLESGAFEIKEGAVDIHMLLNEIIQDAKILAHKKGLEIILKIDEQLPDLLIVDGAKIEEILNNLLNNAIKFTSEGQVEVSLVVTQYNHTKNTLDMTIFVKDSGMGIAESNHQKIFEIFEKRENCNDIEFQGTGLGLSINRKMARLMDGDINLESQLGVGSTFMFSLKDVEVVLLNAENEDDANRIDFGLIKPDGAQIMIIDENTESHTIISKAFSNTAVKVYSFTNPRDAIEKLRESKFDLIFVDIDILTIDDNAVSKVIAKMSKSPVVSLTTVSVKDMNLDVDDANLVGHLKKPISKVELFKLAIKVLNSSGFVANADQNSAISTKEFMDIDKENLKAFIALESKEVAELYAKALSTNDLNAMKLFAEKLSKIASKYEITPFMIYAKKLLEHIELFDIETINRLMPEYQTTVKRIQNL